MENVVIVVDSRARRNESAALKGVQKIVDIRKIYEKIKFNIPLDSCGETFWLTCKREQ